MFAWLSLLGFLLMLGHQIGDLDNDTKTAVDTWVVRVGISRAVTTAHIASFITLFYLCIPLLLLPFPISMLFVVVTAIFTAPVFHYVLNNIHVTENASIRSS